MININRLFSFYLLFLSFSLFAQDPTSCIENPDDYYFSLRNISGDNNFDISDEEALFSYNKFFLSYLKLLKG